ncbi:hypothetical protein JXA80_01340 [bacterium]|nr:hypothetical protein [candidate division CSSED10-310 bacterium]
MTSIRRIAVWIALITIGIIALVWFLSPRRQVQALVRDMRDAVENEDVATCMGWLASEYRDAYGYGVEDIRELLLTSFDELTDIHVTLIDTDIELNQDMATVRIVFRMVATHSLGLRGYVLGDPRLPVMVIVRLRYPAIGWRIVGMERISRVQ